jgi:hypothetical protein
MTNAKRTNDRSSRTRKKPDGAAAALRQLRAIGRLLIARGAALPDVDLGDELVFLGGQALDQAEAALAALAAREAT